MVTAKADSRALSRAVAATLRDLVRESGMTHFDIALKAGLNRRRLARRLSGRMPLKVDEFQAICDVLGVSIAEVSRRALARVAPGGRPGAAR